MSRSPLEPDPDLPWPWQRRCPARLSDGSRCDLRRGHETPEHRHEHWTERWIDETVWIEGSVKVKRSKGTDRP